MADTMLQRCATCAHWGGRDPALSAAARGTHRTCAAPAMYYGYRINVATLGMTEILIESDEGWGMLTGSQFGCIHWTDKEEPHG